MILNWYIHRCANCGCKLRRGSRVHMLAKHGDGLAFPMSYIDSQGWPTCNTSTAVRRFVGANGSIPHRPEVPA